MSFLGVLVSVAVVAATAYYYFYYVARATEASSTSTQDHQASPTAEARSSSKSKDKRHPKKNKKVSSNSTSKKQVATSRRSKIPTHARFVRRFGGHSGDITAFDVSPNGEWIATAGVDGLIRVVATSTKSASSSLSSSSNHLQVQCKVQNDKDEGDSGGMGYFQDHISALSWHGDNRTLTCAIHHSRQVCFFRVRKKKQTDSTFSSAAAAAKNQSYELVELAKRRFSTKSKDMNNIDTCVTATNRESFN